MPFAIGELIKKERRLLKMTQEQLATKTGTKKSFISIIENGKSDIQLSTLYRILELGIGEKFIENRIKASSKSPKSKQAKNAYLKIFIFNLYIMLLTFIQKSESRTLFS
ncbi:helix-turn-helix domain-containing protein [Cyclobacterium qasimii]|uniref:HTH cro/C1-type domain-containing protein n=2 Tax=Cyclobacterium qasimii TaxID=1350429 RepID=S7X451_9BACT|nr:helix-turn-helix transcriptional regulator [Cyclobacterium qasimii]EPR70883.1 hypothetical protein ADICYQ_0879 [Cyclobacterium qasimii M12-11B]GEO23833.1 hypothetical protein CQA01_43670 [Cyclobacterium qasimii]